MFKNLFGGKNLNNLPPKVREELLAREEKELAAKEIEKEENGKDKEDFFEKNHSSNN